MAFPFIEGSNSKISSSKTESGKETGIKFCCAVEIELEAMNILKRFMLSKEQKAKNTAKQYV